MIEKIIDRVVQVQWKPWVELVLLIIQLNIGFIVFFGEISWSCCAGWVGTSHRTVERWVGTSSVLDLGTGLGARAVWALTEREQESVRPELPSE